MLECVAVVNQYELVDCRNALELLLEVMIQLFSYVLVDVYDSLIFLEFGYCNDILRYFVVDIIHIRRLPDVYSEVRYKLLDVEQIEVPDIRYQVF